MASNDLALSQAVLSHFSELIAQLNKGPMRVYACLARMSPEGEPVDISQRDLARASNVSRSNVQIALAILEQLELLKIFPGTRTQSARYQLLKFPDLVPDPIGRGPANQEVDLPADQPAANRSTFAPEQVQVCPSAGPLKPLNSLEKNGHSRAFHCTTLEALSTVSECSAPGTALSQLAEELTGFRFRCGDPLLARYARLPERFGKSERDVARFLERKIQEKRRYKIRSLGALCQWLEADLALLSAKPAPRKPPQAEQLPLAESDHTFDEEWLRVFYTHPQAAAAGGAR